MLTTTQKFLRNSLTKNSILRTFSRRPSVDFHGHKGGIVNSPNPVQVELKYPEGFEFEEEFVEIGFGRNWDFETAEEDMLLGHWAPADWTKVKAIDL